MTNYGVNDLKKYVSDVIGDEYEYWKDGNVIFITAPTGSGKSHFILHEFLNRAIREGKKILYLVNRRVLKKQLEVELNEIDTEKRKNEIGFPGVNNYISVELYQSIEAQLLDYNFNEMVKGNLFPTFSMVEGRLSMFSYVVCDECHYFYSDSLFNTNTELSFDCIRRLFDSKLQIYMSATISNVRDMIEARKPLAIMQTCLAQDPKTTILGESTRYLEYNAEIDYSYIQLKYFMNEEHLLNIIQKGVNVEKSKWLIFVDSIDMGKKLYSQLIRRQNSEYEEEEYEEEYDEEEEGAESNILKKNDILFIDAEYEKRESAYESVNELIKNKCIQKKVIISTAVLDNGISFHDANLRNIVIFADTPEMFIQMLGRKRKDKSNITLYVCKRSLAYFRRRLNQTENVLNFYRKFEHQVKCLYKRNFGYLKEPVDVSLFEDMYFLDKNLIMKATLPDGTTNQFLYRNYYPCYKVLCGQQELLNAILSDKRGYESAKKVCYSVRGQMALNKFSVQQCINQQVFYKEMINRMEDDDLSFVKQQAEWLQLEEGAISAALAEGDKEISEMYRERIENAVKPWVDKDMSIEENRILKISLKNEIVYFLEKWPGYEEKIGKAVKKGDRPLNEDRWNACMEMARLPYVFKKEGVFKVTNKTTKSKESPASEQ